MDLYYKLAMAFVFAYVMAKILGIFKLPSVTGYLIGGLILGPSFFKLIGPQEVKIIEFVNDFALAGIAFNIGSAFLWDDFKKLGKEVMLITFYEVLVVVVLVFLVMFLILRQSFVFSLIIASMSAATAPAGTMMVIQQYRAKGPLSDTILPITALDDVLGVIVFGVSLSIAKMLGTNEGFSIFKLFYNPLKEIVLAVIIGFVLALIFSRLRRFIKNEDDDLVAHIALLMANLALSYKFQVSPLLSAMVLGGVICNLVPHSIRSFTNLNRFMNPFNLLFFAFAGASLDLKVLGSIGLMGVTYVLARGIGKWAGATLGAHRAGSIDTVKKYIGLALLPQGGISIGLSMIVARELPEFSHEVITVILFSVLVFEIMGPIFAKIAIEKAGEARV